MSQATHNNEARRPGMRALAIAGRVLFPPLSIFGFWYLAVAFLGLPDFVIPRPGAVLSVLINENHFILENLWPTLQAAALGYLLANVVGIALAVIVTSVPFLNQLLMPAAITLRNVPYVALATVLALAIGDTMLSKVLILTIAGFFPVMVNTVRGIQSVDSVVLDRMRILDVSPWRVFWQVRLPYSLPFIMAAQEIVGSASISIAIAAEWMLSSSGLGYVINRAMSQYRGDEVYAVALLAALISYVVYLLIQYASRKLDWLGKTRPTK
ncbi:ABC transporter permease [Variovorax rhizosphaerae]|uniref:ABC transporter permease n=1 Tax=Variovorax rhizosphaerae TaxID=1836200 RepID=A0ABU8WLA2_9BURK